ncbi:MAG: 4Fe-4S dicluster domain-containing protein [Candidatus Helarchaeota archaeon]
MLQKHIIVDPEKCTGCEICEFVCSAAHIGAFNPYYSRIRAIRIEPIINFALGCQFCRDPPCAAVCPWNALEKDEETGIILVNSDKCVGCGFCVRACEFGAISMSLSDKIVLICDQCKDQEDGPQCVKYCPREAISFETLDSFAQKERTKTTEKLIAGIAKTQE